MTVKWVSRRIARDLPRVHRSNFLHLYLDIAWFGVLSGSSMAFLSVYMARLGASAFQIGLVNAGPALVTMLLALPAGWWLSDRPLDRAVLWSSIAFRFFYLLWIPLPILFSTATQIGFLIGLTFMMSIPGAALAVGFNALFAEVVPPRHRGRVVGVRNALLAVTFTTTSLLCGVLLNSLTYPAGYQVVFALGFLGAALSSLHLAFIRPVRGQRVRRPQGEVFGNLGRPGQVRTFGDAIRHDVGLRFLIRLPRQRNRPLEALQGSFAFVLLGLFAFHLTQYMAIPLYPLYWVDRLGLSDGAISLGNALFYAFLFLGSTQLAWITRRWGNHRSLVIGALLLSVYPIMTAMTRELGMFLLTAIFGGLFAALSTGALGNYVLEKVPEDRRPLYLAWYTMALNAAILLGSLTGPVLSNHLGLGMALALAAGARALSSLALWRLGR